MPARPSGSTRLALGAAAVFGCAAIAPMACFFPSYVYDETGGSASHGSSSGTVTMSTSTTGTGGTSSTSSGTTGGMTTTTTTTTMTIPPCSKRDCSDPTCGSTFSCVPAAPAGWTGFFELYDDTAVSPGCSGEWPTSALVGNDGIMVPDAMCACKPCTASGQTCAPGGGSDAMHANTVDELLVIDTTCNGTVNCGGPLEVPDTWGGACYGPDGFPAGAHTCGAGSDCTNGTGPCNVSIQALQLKLSGGTCGAPGMPVKTLPNVTWTNNAEACGSPMPGTGCNAGHSCLATPQGAFVKGVCVMQSGESSCPAGFTDQHIIYDPSKTEEGRTCGACACGAMTGGSCSATITVYSAGTIDTCTGLAATLNPTSAQGDCQPLTGNPAVGSREAVYGPVTQGTCAASGGAPGGTATAAGATTFCCTM